jgi:serine/threonine-protein kinase
MQPDELYNAFIEAYVSRGATDVDESWPEVVKARCRFFLDVARTGSRSRSTDSALASLSAAGVDSGLTIDEPDGGGLASLLGAGERYVYERDLARGGMGRVVVAYDRDLRRRVAVKVLLAPAPGVARASRFLDEAQATAQLEHPNIAPVYDLGVSESGAPFFTMKWIRGRSLAQAIGSGEASLIRLVQILQQAAMGVDFAHSRGVIHRDLKPDNVMVGDYGEVLVVDWGIAKVLGRDKAAAAPAGPDLDLEAGGEAVSTERSERGVRTLEGAIQGSVAFMSPEQARGDVSAVDRRTDVFGLGTILYMILTGRPLYEARSLPEVLELARRGAVTPPRERAPDRDVPAALEEICLKALAPEPAQRFESARELHDRLQDYVESIHDRERRAAETERLLAEARSLRDRLEASRREESDLARRARAAGSSIHEHDDPAAKAPLWKLKGEEHRAREASSRLFNDVSAAYQSVLRGDPANAEARRALGELYSERLMAAEERGDAEARGLYLGLVEQFADAPASALVLGETPVAIRSSPAGAEILLSRYEEGGMMLVETPALRADSTPASLSLPRGSYLAVIRLAGYREARLPFLVERRIPVEASVRLRTEDEIPPGFVQVPAGRSIIGGDRLLGGLERARADVAEFLVSRFPVTLGEYCEFLNERFRGRELPDERDLYPLLPVFDRQKIAIRGEDGVFRPRSELNDRVPVLAITVRAMREYCRWLGGRLGRPIRLLSQLEWERAARGADGRLFPWGNEFDWAFCKGAPSRPGNPLPEAVGAFSLDVSPFGVRDLSGGVREVCEPSAPDKPIPLKGGSWYHALPLLFRCDASSGLEDEDTKSADVGFRVACSLEP